ncbi:hypothetical protein Tco_1280419, partial [Tanacetum coccineum]
MVTVLEVWYFRKDGSAFDPHTVYVDNPEVFSMKLFHGGTFTPTPNRRYIMYYHFKIPDKNLDWGLRALASDDDIIYLSKFVKYNKVIEVYIEHGETTVEKWLSNDQVEQHSGLGGAENASGEDNAASGDENES